MNVAIKQAKISSTGKILSIEEKIDALELRKNIELSLIEDDEGKTIPVEQAFEEIRQGLVSG